MRLTACLFVCALAGNVSAQPAADLPVPAAAREDRVAAVDSPQRAQARETRGVIAAAEAAVGHPAPGEEGGPASTAPRRGAGLPLLVAAGLVILAIAWRRTRQD